MQLTNANAGKVSLLDWLGTFEEKCPKLSWLGLGSAWQELVLQNKCPLSVKFTEQRFVELGCNSKTHLAVLFGSPLSHSLSPALHNFFNLGTPSQFCLYLPTQVESESAFRQILQSWQALPVIGANVTSPFKECAFRYLLEHGHLSQEALAIQAVNTIYSLNGKMYGDNTDWSGWLASWRHYIKEELAGRQVVVFGAGGAARAIVYALIRAKVASITIVNSPRRGQKLVADFNDWQQKHNSNQAFIPIQNCPAWLKSGEPGYVYIQATVLGSSAFPKSTPYKWSCSSALLKTNTCIFNNADNNKAWTTPLACDLIYNPAQTEFLRLAKKSGAKTMNGLGMLICQAYRARAKFFALQPSETEEERLLDSFSDIYSRHGGQAALDLS